MFSWEANKAPLEDLLSFTWLQKDTNPPADSAEDNADADEMEAEPSEESKEEQTFASLIIAGTIEHIEEIDRLIEAHLSAKWSMERLNKVALAILRTSVYEIKFQKDAVPGIVIDQAVTIAKQYGSDDSYKFINAILDKIGKNE